VGLGIGWSADLRWLFRSFGASSSRFLAATVFELLIAGFGTVLFWAAFVAPFYNDARALIYTTTNTWRVPLACILTYINPFQYSFCV